MGAFTLGSVHEFVTVALSKRDQDWVALHQFRPSASSLPRAQVTEHAPIEVKRLTNGLLVSQRECGEPSECEPQARCEFSRAIVKARIPGIPGP